MKLVLLEPADPGAEWAPFAGVRPIAELRAGAWRIRERWQAVLGLDDDASAILGPHVEGFTEPGAAPILPAGAPIVGPAVVARATFAPEGTVVPWRDSARRLVHDGETVAWILGPGEAWDAAAESGPALELPGLPLRGTYDLLTALEHLLVGDCADFLGEQGDPLPEGTLVLGDPAEVVSLGAFIEPGSVFDVRHGAIVLEEGVEVRSGSRLEGPLYAAAGTRLLGGFIRQSVFGPECRVRGEVTTSVFHGYDNKAHDGFVGHSVLGTWVNLGAGTTTSNLKNTYGPVRLELPTGRLDTGRMFLGSLVGDHAKTGIGTMLSTGTVIGTGANVVGAVTPPRHVPPFAWGAAGATLMDEDGFLRVVERVLPRRNIAVTDELRASLRATWRRATGA